MTSTAGQRSARVVTERTGITASDFAREIIRLEAASESRNLLIYGDSNAGKTWLSGTCPGRTFWLAGEPGFKSASRMGARGGVRRITDTATAWAAVDWLRENDRYTKLDWLVLDGLSTMQDNFRFNYAAEAFDINPAKRQHRNLPDKPDYFNTQNMLKAWIACLVDMPVNLLITAHAYRTEDTDAELLVFPGIQGKVSEVANSISGLVDAVGYIERRRIRSKDGQQTKIIRKLYFQDPDNGPKGDQVKYVLGDKFNCLPPVMVNPTMTEIIALIDGEGVSNA